ncbi:hypothetical protein ACO22_04173 [Paracoccidioides brasiliensis]|uniref:Uncharacterized protein n=1 Tax=Paracoccidioides brasiliensis TaxID=121759 RepID=A0A1D2JDX9_PARBR|nr:hypothetical protein ACO22_04173 [Paracoccidioides brasiliensis]
MKRVNREGAASRVVVPKIGYTRWNTFRFVCKHMYCAENIIKYLDVLGDEESGSWANVEIRVNDGKSEIENFRGFGEVFASYHVYRVRRRAMKGNEGP